MAIFQKGNTYGKMKLGDGARGWNEAGDQINRSQHTLNTSMHEATNIKYGMDDRLQVEFKYGYGAGYNQMLAAKGRIVAVDPYLEIFDADTQTYDNALTLANGGVDVEYKEVTVGGYTGKVWTSVGVAAHKPGPDGRMYLATDFESDGKALKANVTPKDSVRPANTPIGILIRNEYTRDYNALNGISPGAVNTDCMTELPYFVGKDKALANPWGCAYAADGLSLKPGDLVKSDETGRFVLSPLSDIETFFGAEPTMIKMKEYELERQQVIGQVYEVRKELIPMGAARYAQWALSDILEFEEFNPDLKRKTNRRGEDNIESTAFQADGKAPFGYETTFNESDLHMLGLGTSGSRQAYNKRMQHRYRFDFGIPGLTDGHNAIKKAYGPEVLGKILKTAAGALELQKEQIYTFRLGNTDIEKDSVKIGGNAVTVGSTLTDNASLKVIYLNELQGIIQFKVVAELAADYEVKASYEKRGQAGVPTHLDWDGCVGTVKILLQK